MLWLVLAALALGTGAWCDLARLNLAMSADFQTLEILNEDYHWGFVIAPRRVDEGRRELVRQGKYIYFGTLPAYLPHYLLQLVVPQARSFFFVHGVSIYISMLLLTFLFFAGLEAGASPSASFLITAATLAHPFLLRLFVAAPVIPSCALFPLAWLFYLRRRLAWALLFILLASFSYRLGSIFFFLFFLADQQPGSRENQRRTLLRVLGSCAGIQILVQIVQLHLSAYFSALEGPRVDYVFAVIARFLEHPLDTEVWTRFGEAAVWLLAGGIALLPRKLNSKGAFLPAVIFGYIWWVTGALSQAMLLFLGIAAAGLLSWSARRMRAVAASQFPVESKDSRNRLGSGDSRSLVFPSPGPREGDGGPSLQREVKESMPSPHPCAKTIRPMPASPSQATGKNPFLRRITYHPLLPAVLPLVVGWVAAFVAPLVRTTIDADEMGAPQVEEFRTLADYLAEAYAAPPHPHLVETTAAIEQQSQASLCLVDPFLLPFISGNTCAEILPAGREPLSDWARPFDLLLIDKSEVASRFNRHLARTLRFPSNQSALYRENLRTVGDKTKFALIWSVDGVQAFRPIPSTDERK